MFSWGVSYPFKVKLSGVIVVLGEALVIVLYGGCRKNFFVVLKNHESGIIK